MNYLTLVLLFFTSLTFSQDPEKCGIDNNPLLNNDEAIFLNDYLKDERDDFDFTGKKILVVGGSGASHLESKNQYFKGIKEWGQGKIATQLYAFTDDEKKASGGYDAIVSYWTKTEVNKQKVIRKIKNGKWKVPGC
ncbi:MAG: hypothetical protein DI539_01410 [Flavobacterium psychrophilum]|nr:MAG: hypothetical protein DI539_01410 [Flavobacterium psychrophilum]